MVTYLLDTAPFLWAVSSPHRLSVKVRNLLEKAASPINISAATLWEVMIKTQNGSLSIPNAPEWLERAIRSLDAAVVPVRAPHTYALERLPAIHRDPFDRLLLAQAMAEGWVLVTSDETVRKYP